MSDPEIETAQRIVELMVLTACADGRVDGGEAIAIHRQVLSNPLLRKAGNEAAINQRARARLAEVGLEKAVRESAQAIVEKAHRDLALRCCVLVIGADGRFHAEEARVLAVLRGAFGLSREEVQRLLQPGGRGA